MWFLSRLHLFPPQHTLNVDMPQASAYCSVNLESVSSSGPLHCSSLYRMLFPEVSTRLTASCPLVSLYSNATFSMRSSLRTLHRTTALSFILVFLSLTSNFTNWPVDLCISCLHPLRYKLLEFMFSLICPQLLGHCPYCRHSKHGHCTNKCMEK